MPEDDLPHFVIEAVGLVDIAIFRAEQRGTCSAQHELHTMSALVIRRCAIRMLSSPRIARSSVRFVVAKRHRDLDTITKLQRANLQ